MTLPEPPLADPRPQTRTHHGDAVVDLYEWLRDKEDPDVVAYLEAENAYAEARTGHLGDLRTAIYAEIKARTKETDAGVAVGNGPWWYYTRTVEGGAYGVYARAPRHPGSPRPDLSTGEPIDGEEILLDADAMGAEHEYFALGAFSVSADHRTLAYSVDTAGDERFDLTVKDLVTGTVREDRIQGLGYGAELTADGSMVYVTRVDDAWRPHEVWRYAVGGGLDSGELILREDDERFWLGLGATRDNRFIQIGLGSKITSEHWLLDAADPAARPRCITPRREGVEYDIEVAGERILIVHNADNINSDLAWAPLTADSADDWQPLLNSAAGERFQGIDAFDDVAVLSLRRDGRTELRVLERDDAADSGWRVGSDLTFDEELYTVAMGENPESATTRVLVTFESYVTPGTVLEIDLRTGAREVVKQAPVLGDYDPSVYVQRRLWATAPDGTRVPVSLVTTADAVADGSHPGFLTGYGSYEHSHDPYFSIPRLSLLERGVVFAVAHIRGGGEMGRQWYEQGKLLHKRNTFTDFVAAAQLLHDEGWVAADRLAAYGGSAGGLLMGAATNLAPDLFRVVHADVAFVDALTTILDPSLPLTVMEWEEWGDPLHDPDVYAYMRSYTPYENVAARDYPAILATTSLNDTRVYFVEPAKWVARLRTTVTNDPQTRPILLRTEMVAGHGGRSGRYARWEQIAWEWAFVLDQIGASERV
ncbi:MAG TPA: S9 family peptidase [Intrasporangiaceae bacterium]|nr:S9 family peptidase [Intrasporangiaceae bacterium]